MGNKSKILLGIKIALYALTLALLILSLADGKWGHAGLCALSLALYFLPALVGVVFHARIPALLEGICICFAAAANLGGEVLGLYIHTPAWDAGLHFLWGILAAVIGYAMPDLLGRREGISGSLPRSAAVVISVSFAMLIAVLWEFTEFFVDLWFQTDMQKDSWIYCISSVMREPDGLNIAVTEEINSVIVNGETWPAYLDIGLRDTMSDLLWTFAGSIPGAALVLTERGDSGPSPLLTSLLPRPKPKKDGNTKK